MTVPRTATHASPVLEIIDIHKAFRSQVALAGARFEVHPREWVALLGPNGAGKTTLIRAVAGRVALDGGQIRLHGQILGPTVEAERARFRLGVVPQEIALYGRLTAIENLQFFGRLHGLSRSALRERVEWALGWTGLSERAREPVLRFSGGMRRRLNLACGVLHRPEVLLLDEPTVGVDPQSRERIWEMLALLRREGASLLMATHQLDEAQQTAERIVIMDRGSTVATGTFDALLEQTIGTQRRVIFRLADSPSDTLKDAGFETLEGGPADRADGEHAIRHQVDDLASELPELLAAIAATGGSVVHLTLEEPTLQAVFIHLTGRALRE